MRQTALSRASERKLAAAMRAGSTFTGPRTPLRARSAKTERLYSTARRPLVAALFAEPEICEVPWCTELATDPHEPLTRARGGSITDRANVRKVCHGHNVMFATNEKPWMYELGFLVHSWDAPGGVVA